MVSPDFKDVGREKDKIGSRKTSQEVIVVVQGT